MDQLANKNFTAVKQALADLYNKYSSLVDEVSSLKTNTIMLQQQIMQLQQNVALLQAMQRGHGPTG